MPAIRVRPEAVFRSYPALSCGLPQRFRRTKRLHVVDLDPCRDPALAAILKSDLGGNVGFMRAVVERGDQWCIALRNEPAAYLLRAGQFAIVRIKLLVQNEKAANLRARQHLFFG